MIFVEPNNEYTNRKAAEKRAANEQLIRTLYGPSRWEDGWDESICHYLQKGKGDPVRVWDVVNGLSRGFRGQRNREEMNRIKTNIFFALELDIATVATNPLWRG